MPHRAVYGLVIAAIVVGSANPVMAKVGHYQDDYTYPESVVAFPSAKMFLIGEMPDAKPLAPPPMTFPGLTISTRTENGFLNSGAIVHQDIALPGTMGVRDTKGPRSLGANNPTGVHPVRSQEGNECELSPIYFGLDRHEGDPRTVKAQASKLADCGAQEVRVTGYACELGDDLYNDKLSLARARWVADLLQAQGITVRAVEGRGERDLVTKDPALRHLNRRVRIDIHSSGKEQK